VNHQHTSTNFRISGMHCASCAKNIERKVRSLPGVHSASVNYGNETAYVEHDPSTCDHEALAGAVKSLGYKAHLHGDSEEAADRDKQAELASLKTKLVVSIALTAPVLIGAMFPSAPSLLRNPLFQFLFSTPVQFWVGWQYYQSTWSGLKNRVANMDTLIALGTSVAYFYSLFVLAFQKTLSSAYNLELHFYFEVSATIITLILLGKYLELKAKGQTSRALKKLLGLQVKTARLLVGGKETTVPLGDVKVGDRLLVKPGDKIPVDAVVVKGDSAVDESMITGESLPVAKAKGSKVIGSTLNISGVLEIETTKVGSETMLAQIVELVRRAQGSRAPIQKLADVVSSYFVPAVIILALLTFLVWYNFGPEPQFLRALVNTIAVLIIACPCALGLATPTSIMVATGRGAGEGILVRNAEVLELAAQAKTVLFDKTGTLTEGKPRLQKLELDPAFVKQKSWLLRAISAVESKSHHPLAAALVAGLPDSARKGFSVTKFRDIPGFGVQAKVDGKEIAIGARRLLEKLNISPSPHLTKVGDTWSSKGWTQIEVALSGRHAVTLAVADSPKKDSPAVLETLRRRGIAPIMVTGDNKKTALAVARELGIGDVEAEVLPADKESLVRKYKSKGRVIMVGDGINDAPALAASDVGIAMGEGTDVAIESAGITLLRSDITLVPKSISLSSHTMRNIKQNLGWAFGYNLLLVPVAMGALYPFFGLELNPILASGAMAFSSVSVVLNSLRLGKIKL